MTMGQDEIWASDQIGAQQQLQPDECDHGPAGKGGLKRHESGIRVWLCVRGAGGGRASRAGREPMEWQRNLSGKLCL